jgi:hypothetical protein
MTAQFSLTLAPDYIMYREGVDANDVIANVPKSHGLNAAMYKYAHIQVVPSGGANPTMNLYWWSEHANKWIQDDTPYTVAPKGANIAYEVTINSQGRRFFIGLTTISVGKVDVMASGFEHVQGSH